MIYDCNYKKDSLKLSKVIKEFSMTHKGYDNIDMVGVWVKDSTNRPSFKYLDLKVGDSYTATLLFSILIDWSATTYGATVWQRLYHLYRSSDKEIVYDIVRLEDGGYLVAQLDDEIYI